MVQRAPAARVLARSNAERSLRAALSPGAQTALRASSWLAAGFSVRATVGPYARQSGCATGTRRRVSRRTTPLADCPLAPRRLVARRFAFRPSAPAVRAEGRSTHTEVRLVQERRESVPFSDHVDLRASRPPRPIRSIVLRKTVHKRPRTIRWTATPDDILERLDDVNCTDRSCSRRSENSYNRPRRVFDRNRAMRPSPYESHQKAKRRYCQTGFVN